MLEADVAHHLRQTQQRLNQMLRERVGQYHLTFKLLHILMLIERNPDTNQNRIAAELKFTKGAMSGYVKRLIKLKMVTQESSSTDQRCKQLALTDYASSILQDYEGQVRERYRDIFTGFTPEELAAFNASLAKINGNLNDIETPAIQILPAKE